MSAQKTQPQRVDKSILSDLLGNCKEENYYFEELVRARSILSVVNAALGGTAYEANPDPNVVRELIRQLCEDLGLSNPSKVASRLDEDEKQQIRFSPNSELGLNHSKTAERLDDDEQNTLTPSYGIRGNPNMTIINESGLYSVILRSDKPEAKAFKRWVTHEVLPSIRRTGRYEVGDQTAPMALQGPGAAPLPLAAQSIWFTLLWLEKEQGGRGEVSASNDRLMSLMGVSGHHTLAARDALAKAGYIEHTPGVKAHPGVYKLLPQRGAI